MTVVGKGGKCGVHHPFMKLPAWFCCMSADGAAC